VKKIILAVAVLIISVARLSAQSVDEIVSKNLDATGGVSKLREVRSIVTETTVKLQGLQIENMTTVLVGRAMRSDSKILGDNMVQAFDGTTPWTVNPVMMGGTGEPQVMTEEMSKGVINQVDPFPLLDYNKKGTRVELLPSEKVKDKESYHLKISPKAGAESEIWIDVTTGLPSKLKTIQNGQDVEIVFSNYTKFDGVMFATSMETSNPMAGVIAINTKTVKVNTAIDESIFKMPVAKN